MILAAAITVLLWTAAGFALGALSARQARIDERDVKGSAAEPVAADQTAPAAAAPTCGFKGPGNLVCDIPPHEGARHADGWCTWWEPTIAAFPPDGAR